MEDYASYLAEEAKSDIVALHQFRILYDPELTAFHFFFEGEEDSLFYMPEARRHLGEMQTYIYDCGGKKNVIEVRDAIKSESYDVSNCLFFIDRDFDDLLNTQPVIDEYTYITDNYSIENDISTVQSARVLLMDVLRISQADPEFQRIEGELNLGFQVFFREIRPLIAWILAAKQSNCAPNIQNTAGLKGVMTMSGTRVTLTKAGFSEFKKKVVVNGRLPAISMVLKWRRLLDLAYATRWVRGKYVAWFFQVALLSALAETNIRRKQAGARAFRIPSSLRDGRIFEILGGRTNPPASLQYFYQTRLRTRH